MHTPFVLGCNVEFFLFFCLYMLVLFRLSLHWKLAFDILILEFGMERFCASVARVMKVCDFDQ